MKIRAGFVSNSSTACFICEAKYPITEAIKILEKILDFYNELFEEKLLLDEVFKEPFFGTKEDEKKYVEGWEYHGKVEGKLIIEGAGSNSVPYDLQELICSKFKADYLHLG